MDNLQTIATSTQQPPQAQRKLTEEELNAGAELALEYLGQLSEQKSFIPRNARELAVMAAGALGISGAEALQYVLRMQKKNRQEDLTRLGYNPH